ncbi:MAG TPA: Uma2 family endonuclease [Nocardioides sp.]|uniref:Uma2 family endonuclease n=1 Tax=uncultured Nocardioides sp. TaxID=198441 RepID=UPI0026352CD7|nr:Uma2 family endonuclease [uncultured Nocardioides sp.]HRD63695.1 Uma2 family endonuclease [Nocardioides sp.]HRI97149.1 Uma2 family endonuclease [Nocardioides sp.]HRK46627.1 Uma2 family endonuclease [Nocardioides sp.]
MTALEPAGLFTRADFEKLPEFPGETRYRYELLDGAIIVSPSPGLAHQQAVLELAVLLREAAPSGLMVAVSPLDTYLPTGDVLEPDVLVFDPAIIVDDKLQGGVPLLAVEVLSPSSRRRDVGDKLTAYRDAGVPSYWVVDPIDPRLRAWSLVDGAYVEIADVSGDEEWTAAAPYAVTFRPSDLTAGH